MTFADAESPVPEPAPASGTSVAATAGVSSTAELEAEDPRHKKARRLARVLVSEIKLYNEAEVLEGRRQRDLYARLKEPIDRSVENYRQRVPNDVRDRYDYLYDELVRQLAEGDPAVLGPGAPSPH